MHRELINEFVKCFLDSAYAEGEMESAQPLHRVEEIRKQLSEAEYTLAMKESLLALLEKDFVVQAMGIIEGSEDFKKLVSDPEVKKLAQAKFEDAVSRQMEVAETIKKTFQL